VIRVSNPAITVSGGVFQTPYDTDQPLMLRGGSRAWTSCNPDDARPAGLARHRFRLYPRFARHYYGGASSSSGYVRCFSSPGSLPLLRVATLVAGLPHSEIVGSQAARRLPHAYRSGATSFVGTQRRGIHRVLIVSSLQEHLRGNDRTRRRVGRTKCHPAASGHVSRRSRAVLLSPQLGKVL
jgi:hypothetical protein